MNHNKIPLFRPDGTSVPLRDLLSPTGPTLLVLLRHLT